MARRPTPLARRLSTVEKMRDGRRLMHTYRLTDGRTVRLSTLDVLGTVRDGLALHGQHPAEPPPDLVRTLAHLDPGDDPSVLGATAQAVAAEWCAAYDEHRPVALYDTPEEAESGSEEAAQ